MNLEKVKPVLISNITVSDTNVRHDLDSANSQEGLRELADSIEANGLLQPIVLRGVDGHPPYEVIVGQRRFRAHQILNREEIDAVFAGNISKTQATILSLSENLLRQEMNHADIAKAVTDIYIHFGRDEHKVKEKLGLSTRAIRSYINVEEQATDRIKELLGEGLSMADAKRAIIAGQGDPEKANAIAESISKLTKFEKNRAVEFSQGNPEASAQEIIKVAKTPRVSETLILNLPLKVSRALKVATQQLQVDSEEIAMSALTDWLKINDFLLA